MPADTPGTRIKVTTTSDTPRSAVGPVGRADTLGWASAALGAPMITVPRRLLSIIGVRADGQTTAIVVGVGIRELMATVQINVMRHRRIGAWARVAGDTMDLALLGTAFARKRADAGRLLGAVGFVAGIFAADLVTALQLSRAERANTSEGAGSAGFGALHEDDAGPAHVRRAVTVAKPVEEVRQAFTAFSWTSIDPRQLVTAGQVRFTPAPGDRGTEVHLDWDPPVAGGAVGATALKLAGRAPDQRVGDELRQFKALVETGVVPRSEKTPEGPSTPRHMMQRPGQPQEVSN